MGRCNKTRVKKLGTTRSKSSDASTISTMAVEQLIEKLRAEHNRDSTKKNYFGIWRNFNEFFIKLNTKPHTWEERLTLFVGYLVQKQLKASTIRSYISGIKAVLRQDGYEINEDQYLLTSLTKARRLVNDQHVRTRLPL